MWMLLHGFYGERQKRLLYSGWRFFCHVFVAVLLLAGLSSCTAVVKRPQQDNTLVYAPSSSASLVQQFAPIFVVEKGDISHNRIGTPAVAMNHDGHASQGVFVDPEWATIYTEVREFTTERGEYTNLVYRVHFAEIPFSLVPFHLGAGKNIGLLVVVTLDSTRSPLLYTLVHTCGCYLAFVATSQLDENMWKSGWDSGRQSVYGENLPRLVSLDSLGSSTKKRLVVQLAPATHRVKNVWPATAKSLRHYSFVPIRWQPLEALEKLRRPDGSGVSFYETAGPRFGYVKGSGKIWERLLISWWALDWYVGEDKKLGRHTDDGIVFYTSLKPWARTESDLRDFVGFLRYWGWKL